MKKICILGWYGTETMGDRAILDGIFAIFSKAYGACDFYIGSLFPVLTVRTLVDDCNIYQRNAPCSCFTMFDSKCELREYIEKSDLVVMGGGPIMELNELYLIDDAFKYAHKCKKKTIIMGCGLGPLTSKRLIDIAKNILLIADLVIFRDKKSLQFAYELTGKAKEYFAIDDPAVISVLLYKKRQKPYNLKIAETHELAINFREPLPPYSDSMKGYVFESAQELIVKACSLYNKVILVPMHTFAIGNDDRRYFSKLVMDMSSENLEVLNRPLNLYELYAIYTGAEACIGMRYHSIVMQTLLNGNNYILDYTEKGRGKISGFLVSLTGKEFFKNRYVNITNKVLDVDDCLKVLKECKHYRNNVEVNVVINNYLNLLLKQ